MSDELDRSMERHPAGKKIDRDQIKADLQRARCTLDEWMKGARSGEIIEVGPNDEITVSDDTGKAYSQKVTPERRKLAEKRIRNVIERITAPPETIEQHLARLGAVYSRQIIRGREFILIDAEKLDEVERREE